MTGDLNETAESEIKHNDETLEILNEWALEVGADMKRIDKWHKKWVKDRYTITDIKEAIAVYLRIYRKD